VTQQHSIKYCRSIYYIWFNWTTFNCWFEMSSDKLQNVSKSSDSLSNYC